jgi:hypothetical protein
VEHWKVFHLFWQVKPVCHVSNPAGDSEGPNVFGEKLFETFVLQDEVTSTKENFVPNFELDFFAVFVSI